MKLLEVKHLNVILNLIYIKNLTKVKKEIQKIHKKKMEKVVIVHSAEITLNMLK